jgi:hypothetical protein
MKRILIGSIMIIQVLLSQEFSSLNHAILEVGLPNSVWKVMGFSDWDSNSLNSQKRGWFVDLGMSIPIYSTGDDYYDKSAKFSEETLGDQRIDNYDEFLMINIGLTKPIKSNIFYLGGGLTNRKQLYQYYDEFEILGGNDGKYWVNGDVDEWKVNICGGMVIKNSISKRMKYILLGFDLIPAQVNIGVGW